MGKVNTSTPNTLGELKKVKNLSHTITFGKRNNDGNL